MIWCVVVKVSCYFLLSSLIKRCVVCCCGRKGSISTSKYLMLFLCLFINQY